MYAGDRILLRLTYFLFLAALVHSSDYDNLLDHFAAGDISWKRAMDMTFASKSGSSATSENILFSKNIQNMLIRQGLPTNVSTARQLDDVELYRILFLAGVSGLTPWERDPASNFIFLNEHGHLVHVATPTLVESDIMICIICALLLVIATFHIISSWDFDKQLLPLNSKQNSGDKVQLGGLFQKPAMNKK